MNWWNGQNDPSNAISQTSRRSDRTQPWHSFPNIVPNIGPRWGRRATWIGATGDQTFVKIDEINSISLTRSTVMANKSCISMSFVHYRSVITMLHVCLTIKTLFQF